MKQRGTDNFFMHLHKDSQKTCLFSTFYDIMILFRFAFFGTMYILEGN